MQRDAAMSEVLGTLKGMGRVHTTDVKSSKSGKRVGNMQESKSATSLASAGKTILANA